MLLLHGDHPSGFHLFGYDLPRLHAAINDLPPALLLAAVLLELLYLLKGRESFKAASYWTLIFGTIGTALAVGSGLLAEDAAPHSGAAHELMETHETWAFVSLGLFVVLAGWRIWRERVMSRGERWGALAATLFAFSILTRTAQHGGSLVFDHATGISSDVLKDELDERAKGGHDEHGNVEDHDHDHADSAEAHEHDAH
ncbi:MAG TPA: DUF2231 domain-containing protein [Gemmatimonadales bacterium]|nr:DUF2231 domain-containing protein [Gemmatimonadales bacterium]